MASVCTVLPSVQRWMQFRMRRLICAVAVISVIGLARHYETRKRKISLGRMPMDLASSPSVTWCCSVRDAA